LTFARYIRETRRDFWGGSSAAVVEVLSMAEPGAQVTDQKSRQYSEQSV
jgi:hypothetical protein